MIYFDRELRLKSYKSATSGTRSTITVVIETDSLDAQWHLLRQLAGQAITQRKTKQPKQLALPAPETFNG